MNALSHAALESFASSVLPLVVTAVIGLVYVVYLSIELRNRSMAPARLHSLLHTLLASGRRDEARRICLGNRSALAAATRAAIDCVVRSPEPAPGILGTIIQNERARMAHRFNANLRYLGDLTALAPVVALLCAALGLLTALQSVGMNVARVRLEDMAMGIRYAALAAGSGLAVGLSARLAAARFRGRLPQLEAQFTSRAEDLFDLLLRGRAG